MSAPLEGEQGFWPSYADMMSAVALILFFLMLLSYIQNLITGNDLQNTQELLADTRLALTETGGRSAPDASAGGGRGKGAQQDHHRPGRGAPHAH